MPEVTIQIGGRDFEVSCQEGEQVYLQAAARMLDDEAQVLSDQIGRMPEARMLLMSGLMLADKTAAVEDRIKEVEEQLAERERAEEVALAISVMIDGLWLRCGLHEGGIGRDTALQQMELLMESLFPNSPARLAAKARIDEIQSILNPG